MRYAIYFTPSRNDPLTRAASDWLARDAFETSDRAPPVESGLSQEEWASVTADPRRYGFHATLKAPFSLADGRDEAGLIAAIDAFAAARPGFDIAEMAIAGLGPFFALVPSGPDAVLQAFAGEIVERFEPFRAPLTAADIARRKPEKLGDAQRAYLETYGYPYVLEEFRFHMTLTGPVAEERRPAIRDILDRRFAAFAGKPMRIDALTLFVEPARGDAFTVLHRAPLMADQDRRASADDR